MFLKLDYYYGRYFVLNLYICANPSKILDGNFFLLCVFVEKYEIKKKYLNRNVPPCRYAVKLNIKFIN